jgi:uncharacterized protein
MTMKTGDIGNPLGANAVLGGSKTFSTAVLASVELLDAPIPDSWVLSGRPNARSGALAHSLDGWASSVVWDCTAGSFRWQFGWEETVFILEGSVRVITETGAVLVLTPGDVAYFAQGTSAEWQVDSYVKKIAFTRGLVPAYVRKPLAMLRNLRARIGAMIQSFGQLNIVRKAITAAVGLGGSFALFNMVFEM